MLFKFFFKCLKAYFFIGAGAGVGAGEKKYSEPVKNGPAPQHSLGTAVVH